MGREGQKPGQKPQTSTSPPKKFVCADCKKETPDELIWRTTKDGKKVQLLRSEYSQKALGRKLCGPCHDKVIPEKSSEGGGNGKPAEIICSVPGCGVILTGKTINLGGVVYSWPEVSVRKLGMPYCEAHFAAQKSILAVEDAKRKMAEEEVVRKLAEQANTETLGNVDEIPDDVELTDSQRDLVAALAEAGDFEA